MIWYLHIRTEILHTEVNMNTALKFFTVLYFSENHPSAVELDHGTLQRHRISARSWHIKCAFRTCGFEAASFMVVGDKQNGRIYKGCFLRLIKTNSF